MSSKRVFEYEPVLPHPAPQNQDLEYNKLAPTMVGQCQNGNLVMNCPSSETTSVTPCVDVDEEGIEDEIADLIDCVSRELSASREKPPYGHASNQSQGDTGPRDTRLARLPQVHETPLIGASFFAGSRAKSDHKMTDDEYLYYLCDDLTRLRKSLRYADEWGDLTQCAALLWEIDWNRGELRKIGEKRRPSTARTAEDNLDRLIRECDNLCKGLSPKPRRDVRETARIDMTESNEEFVRSQNPLGDLSQSKSYQSSTPASDGHATAVANRVPAESGSSRPPKRSMRVEAPSRQRLDKSKKELRPPVNRPWKFVISVVLGRAAFLLRVAFPKLWG
jgi:hypothetical protein